MKRYSFLLFLLGLLVLASSFAQQKMPANGISPTWCRQSNIYEVNLRQYSASGSFTAFAKHLPRLRKMGVDILWFMPITPIGMEGRKMISSDLGSYYAVRDYKAVNSEFGTLAEWKELVANAHRMGFKVITDWVPNHTALDNRWVKDHPDFYVKDASGKILSPYDWTDTYKLDYTNPALRDSMIDVMKFWVIKTGIDGFRCDVSEDVGPLFWTQCITAIKKIKNVFMLAEGEKPWLHKAGFNATYTWSVMRAMAELYSGKKDLALFIALLDSNRSVFPGNACRMFFTTNHDENSWNGTEFEKYGDAYKSFAVFGQTMFQSIPLIYNGQEVPNKKRLKFFVKDTIEWDQYAMSPFYHTLLELRKRNPALAADASYKRLTSSNDEAIFCYLRKSMGHKVAVLLNLSSIPQKFTLKDKVLIGMPENVFTGKKEKLVLEHEFKLDAWGYAVYDYQ